MSVASKDQYDSDKGRFLVWPIEERNPHLQEQPMPQDNETGFEYRIPWDDTGESVLRILELRACEVIDAKDAPIKTE
ncbi:MAG: hypothetical protein ACXABV_03765 [Candidatus Thorarchaeota archaeon]|jgi:hypothetical protein